MKIGFDLDGVFVDKPPIIPKSLIERLYKKSSNNLSYRIPGKIEQKIRVASHARVLRPSIRRNLDALALLSSKSRSLFLLSSRFSFLDSKTDEWIKKNGIAKYFQKNYFNFKNEQPHLFKDRIIKTQGIKKFVDDDLDLLLFLARENPKVEFYWLTSRLISPRLPGNIAKIKDLEEFGNKYLDNH